MTKNFLPPSEKLEDGVDVLVLKAPQQDHQLIGLFRPERRYGELSKLEL